MDTFALSECYWQRTSCFIKFDPSVPLQAGDELHLRGTEYNPMYDDEPKACAHKLTNVEIVDETCARVRFLLGRSNNPVKPGRYQLIIRRGGEEAPVSVRPDQIQVAVTSLKRSDAFFYSKTSSYFEVVPQEEDGVLWFLVSAKAFPEGYGYNPKTNFKKAAKAFARSIVDGGAISAFNFFKKTNRQKKGKILFTSDSRSSLSGNMEPLYERMKERGITDSHKVCFSFKSAEKMAKGKPRSVGSYLKLAYHLATSQYVFCDDYQPYLYHVKYKPGTRLIQLWHACGAFKTVGFGRIGTLDAVAPFNNSHRNYTDVIVASDHDAPIYAEAFGLPDDRVKAFGIPRHDWLLDPAWQQDKKAKFAETFPAAQGKRVIVFAPTFRGAGKSTAHYEYRHIDFDRLAEFCREHGYFFIFKMHPFVLQKAPVPANSDDVFADGSAIREINDILPSTDLLITDYSSVVYEAALLNIPTLYFAYDLEDYVSSRSFYEPFEEFVSGRIVRDFDSLLDALATGDCDSARLEAFRQKNFKYLEGGACDRIIDRIILGNERDS